MGLRLGVGQFKRFPQGGSGHLGVVDRPQQFAGVRNDSGKLFRMAIVLVHLCYHLEPMMLEDEIQGRFKRAVLDHLDIDHDLDHDPDLDLDPDHDHDHDLDPDHDPDLKNIQPGRIMMGMSVGYVPSLRNRCTD